MDHVNTATRSRGVLAKVVFFPAIIALLAAAIRPAEAQSNLEKALRFRPSQSGVEIDTPEASVLDKCRIEPTDKETSKPGWEVFDESGRLIRRFLDMNGDGNLDQMSYFRNGIEVYRDIDINADKKFDEMRWLGTAGTRWGLDSDQDGAIDHWKVISAEEVSQELVEAIGNNDANRFKALLVTPDDARQLGLGMEIAKEIQVRTEKAANSFAAFAKSQKFVDSDSTWVHFGGTRPGVIPAGTNNSTKDVMIYDGVTAVVDSKSGEHGQLAIGTLILVDGAWRVVDLPEMIVEGKAITNGGLFYQGNVGGTRTMVADNDGTAPSATDQKLFEEYEELDKAISDASPRELPALHARRAELFMQLIEKSDSSENRSNWVRQMADVTGGAFLNGDFPEGDRILARNISMLKEKKVDPDDIAYAEYRRLSNYWSKKFNEANADDFVELQKQQMDALREFVDSWPESEQSAEAMLQVGLQEEFDGNTKEAIEWYEKITSSFPDTPPARKALGARTRLESEGKAIALTGATVDGSPFSLASLKGKVVLLQYWATWCEPCKEDQKVIAEAHGKYGRRGLEVVSISLDNSAEELRDYLRTARLPWMHLFEEGGLDSPLAEQLGVTIVPTMILVGADGKVVSRNLTANDLDRALSREFKSE